MFFRLTQSGQEKCFAMHWEQIYKCPEGKSVILFKIFNPLQGLIHNMWS